MDDEKLFSAGVSCGGLNSREQIRVMLCELVRHAPEPLTIEQAELVLAQEGLANYFEFRQALDALLEEGKLIASKTKTASSLSLAANLYQPVEELAKDLPASALSRALLAATRLQEMQRAERDQMCSVAALRDGGFYVTFRQGDGSNMLMSVTVFLATREQVDETKAKFLADPSQLFGAVLTALV
ncbi:MAG: DUF4364 family protein [Oscillospiraceae bacterium]|jgi:hypothetical protein|nr:DUF4364 family protein [Oscillospiraceae bacterium]